MPAPVEIGQVLAGKYRVERVLGEGGMGVVVAAWHLELEAMVALKFLLPDILENAQAIERFLREARAAVKLKSENTCQVRDVGRLDNGAPYIVMEYLEGNDLLAELAQRGPLPIHEVASYILQACKAMQEAHAVGIVHRDLKPQNLFLTHRGDGTPMVKVLDFGIAKLRIQDGSATHTAVIMGSPAYMAPEQARSAKHTDSRADIYSLGVILYQLTSGRLPFPALEKGTQDLSLTEILLSVQMDEATPLRAYYPNSPPGWEDVVMRAMAKDPGQRTRDAYVLAEELQPFTNPQHFRTPTPLPFAAVNPNAIQSASGTAPAVPKNMPTAMTGYQPAMSSVVTGAPSAMQTGPGQSMPMQMLPASATTLSSAIHSGSSLAIAPEPKKKKWIVPVLALSVVIVAGVSFAAVKAGGGGDTTAEPAKEPTPEPTTKPEPTKPEPTKPEPTTIGGPEVKPEPTKPEPTKPDVATQEPAKPEPVKPEPVKPKPTKPKPSKPVATKPEPTKPEPTKPEPTKPVATKPEPTKPEPAKPTKPEPAKPCRSDDVVCQFGKKAN